VTLVAAKLVEPALVPSHESAPSLERTKKPRGSFFAWAYPLAMVGGMVLLLVMYLCQEANLVSLQYKMVQLEEKQASLKREKTELVLQVQELTSLSHIEQVATTRLGMVMPKQRLVLDLSDAAPRQAFLKDVVAQRVSSLNQ